MATNKRGQIDRDFATAGIQPYKAALPDVGFVPCEYSWEICIRESYPVPDESVTTHPARFTVVVM